MMVAILYEFLPIIIGLLLLIDKKIAEFRVKQVYQIRPKRLNGAGRLFGGRLMECLDEVAGLVGIDIHSIM